MKYYGIIDTNVVVSSMLQGDSIPGILLKRILNGDMQLVLNQSILDEYEEVLCRNKFNLKKEAVRELIDQLKSKAIFLERTPAEEAFVDKDDVVFYEITLTARKDVDAYLVTGNIKHFPIKHFIVTPREMLEILGDKK